MSLKVSDKLTGSDLLVVSGDLILEPAQLGEFIELHRLKRCIYGDATNKLSAKLLGWTKCSESGLNCNWLTVTK